MAAHSEQFFNDFDFFAPEIANFRSPSGASPGSEGSRGVSRGGRVWIVSRKGSDFQGICARGKSPSRSLTYSASPTDQTLRRQRKQSVSALARCRQPRPQRAQRCVYSVHNRQLPLRRGAGGTEPRIPHATPCRLLCVSGARRGEKTTLHPVGRCAPDWRARVARPRLGSCVQGLALDCK